MIRNTSQKFPPSLILSEIDEIELNSFVWVLRHFTGGWGGGGLGGGTKNKEGKILYLGGLKTKGKAIFWMVITLWKLCRG